MRLFGSTALAELLVRNKIHMNHLNFGRVVMFLFFSLRNLCVLCGLIHRRNAEYAEVTQRRTQEFKRFLIQRSPEC